MTRDPNRRILEAIITTESESGLMHVAPMGPEVNDTLDHWLLKPFQTSTTFENLRRTGRCVVHVTDSASLIAQAVLGEANKRPAQHDPDYGFILEDVSHWFALEVKEWRLDEPRAEADCCVLFQRFVRPFFGWNRAKHAIVELAIVASRVDRLDPHLMANEIERGRVVVEKTAGQDEREAFEVLARFIREGIARRLKTESVELKS